MVDFLLWYLTITIIGWLAFPLVYRLLPGLSDRGYALSRIVGLLIWGYFYWLFVVLGWSANNQGAILLSAGVLLLASGLSLRGGRARELQGWLVSQRSLVITVEILFLAAFGLMAFVRSANPEIVATEKPMELAFINAIRRSPSFPPFDPWLSGYGISYYYFGYVLVVLMAKLLGTTSGVGFNLGIALIFGLSAAGAYGLVYNLLQGLKPAISKAATLLYAVLGPLFVLVVSNFGGLLEVLHARGIFWRQEDGGQWTSDFWRWLGIQNLNQPPAQPLSWLPTRYLWWWRSSRILTDMDLAGQTIEIIDEFPFFSFLLADIHPHVLAIPFAMLAMGLSLNVLMGGMQGKLRFGRITLEIKLQGLLFTMLALGSLAFLNTWDFPIYAALFAGAYVLWQVGRSGWNWYRAVEFFSLVLLIGIGGIILYLPFFLGFQSQAGGILPNLVNPTRGVFLWIMFGVLLLPVLVYLLYLGRNWGRRLNFRFGVSAAVISMLVLLGFSLLLGLAITLLPTLGNLFLQNLAASSRAQVFQAAFTRRFLQPGGWVTLGLLLAGCLAFLSSVPHTSEDDDGQMVAPAWLGIQNSHLFVLLLILMGTLLVLAPEFVYLRDLFNNRMNTIFKFYYQAWLMWGISAAFGSAVLLSSLRGVWGLIYRAGFLLILLAGLIYPLLGLNTKTSGFSPAGGLTLDGTAYFNRQSPDDWAAIIWLQRQPLGTLAEAIGGSYTNFARISTHSGQPTVLGWPFHELQWRGTAREQGSREGDIERLYCTTDWQEAEEILQRYQIRYIYVGVLEYSQYTADRPGCPEGLQERKFERMLPILYENGGARVFGVPRTLEGIIQTR